MEKEKKTIITAQVPAPLAVALAEYSAAHDLSQSQVIRKALAEFLRES